MVDRSDAPRGHHARVAAIAFAALAAALVAAQPGAPRPGEPPHVLLVSIDGLAPASYTDPTVRDAPTLRRLAQQGAYADGVVGVLPSVTYPSHTTLVTGVLPALHGIYDNRLVDPENRSNGAWRWYARQIRVPNLLAATTARGLRAGAVYWPVSVGLRADYVLPEFWRSDHPEGLELLRVLSTPSSLLDGVEALRGRPLDYPLTDESRLDTARFIWRTFRPHLLAVHFVELDSAQHRFGPGSSQARAALARVDDHVARLLEAVDQTGLGDRTFVVIVSDHGFASLERQLQPNAALKEAGLLTVDGRGVIVDWRAYFHSAGGSGFVFVRDPSDQAVRERVRRLLEELAKRPDTGIDAVWSAEELDRWGAYPDAAFGIGMRRGFYTGNGHQALLVAPTNKGGHGFAPTLEEMRAAFIARGPGLARRGSVGVIRMTQIAPTLARWLGVGLSPLADQPIEGLVALPR
jgi:predicted AlkP superfamily pyrophosphatase or phosphodiesterase